jgi:hypothetical protein
MRAKFVGGCLAAIAATGWAAQEPVVTTDLVVGRCQDQYAEFGVELVRACIRADLAAVEALNAYPPADRPRIDACILRDLPKGWTVVRDCVTAGDGPAPR